MSNSERTTFEQAKICPKCSIPGDDTGSKPTQKRGVRVHVIFCRNTFCEWNNTSWLVQINEDGSVPQEGEQIGEKMFPKHSAETETRIRESLERQLQAEQQAGSEIRNPRA